MNKQKKFTIAVLVIVVAVAWSLVGRDPPETVGKENCLDNERKL